MKRVVVGVCVAILVAVGAQALTWSDVDVDPFTDESIGTTYCTNDEAFLVVRNTGGYIEIFFGERYEYIGGDIGVFIYRFDKNETEAGNGGLSFGKDSIFVNDEDIEHWVDELSTSSLLAIKIITYTGESFTIEFDLSTMRSEMMSIGVGKGESNGNS